MPPVGVRVSSYVETQNILQEKTVSPSPGRYPKMTADRARTSAASATWTNAEPDTLMERVLAPTNLKRAYQRVVSNKGAPGVLPVFALEKVHKYPKLCWHLSPVWVVKEERLAGWAVALQYHL